MSEPIKPTPEDFASAAAALGAASAALGAPPADPAARSGWIGEAQSLALDLLGPTLAVAAVVARVTRPAEQGGARPIPGIVLDASVEESSGRAVITFRPLIGSAASSDGAEARETARTERLADSAVARQILATATANIGARVTVFKYNETAASDPNKKVGMVAAIHATGSPVAVPAQTPPADTPPADTPPADTPPADTPPADTPPAGDLRLLVPTSKKALLALASEHLGLTAADLSQASKALFGDKSRLTSVELQVLWMELLKNKAAA